MLSGGETGQESIRNGVFNLEGNVIKMIILLFMMVLDHMVDETVLTDVIVKCEKYGNGVTSMPYNEQIFVIDDEDQLQQYIPRETLRRVSTPQAYKFGKIRLRHIMKHLKKK